jgi:adenosylcobinamide-GDP ribazoletransferase
VLASDLRTAFMLLTRLPVARLPEATTPDDLGRSVWIFPVVGLAVNAIGAAVFWLTRAAGMPPLAGAIWALAATMLCTGALHEDGLADTADGFGGGATPERKLALMRDSRIGSYGALALLLSVIVRAGSIAALQDPRQLMVGMIAAGMLGRGSMLVVLALLRPARADGLAASLGAVPPRRALLGLAIAVAPALLLRSGPVAFCAVMLAFGVALGMARLAYIQIGGYTGDVLGATEVIVECVVLSVVAGASSP